MIKISYYPRRQDAFKYPQTRTTSSRLRVENNQIVWAGCPKKIDIANILSFTLCGSELAIETKNNRIVLLPETVLDVERIQQIYSLLSEVVSENSDTDSTAVAQCEDLKRIQSDLNSLIGLDNIKREIINLINLLKVQKMRKSMGLASPEFSRHMVFYGNPGTGKTTIARKLAEIYKALGILSNGHLLEADRSSFVAGYLGQTAIKTKEVLERARGGILFIDEAYTLCQGSEQDLFGQEAIDTILKYMEDHRDDLIVIVAGYESQMAAFINSNPGLKSRFSKYFYFADYDSAQLSAIFEEMASHAQYVVTDSFRLSLAELCQEMINRKTDNFGNGRTVRNLFEKCISNQANRLVSMPNPSQEQLAELIKGDLLIEDLDIVMR